MVTGPEHNKAVFRRFNQMMTQHDTPAMVGVLHEKFIDYNCMSPVPLDRAACIKTIKAFLDAFPDLNFHTDELIAEGNRVTSRWTATGVFNGPDFFGIPTTGKPARFGGIEIVTVEGDWIVERNIEFNAYLMLKQVGLMPPGL